ncbi:hypothetical protein BDW68DRAFT_149141 [Aspergillus falconensis]
MGRPSLSTLLGFDFACVTGKSSHGHMLRACLHLTVGCFGKSHVRLCCSRCTKHRIERARRALMGSAQTVCLLLIDNKFSPTRSSAGRSQNQRKWVP